MEPNWHLISVLNTAAQRLAPIVAATLRRRVVSASNSPLTFTALGAATYSHTPHLCLPEACEHITGQLQGECRRNITALNNNSSYKYLHSVNV